MRENLAVLNEGEKQQDCCAKGNDRGAVFETGRTWVLTSKTVQKSFRMDSKTATAQASLPSPSQSLPLSPSLLLLMGAPASQTKGTNSKREQERPGGKTSELVQSGCQAV